MGTTKRERQKANKQQRLQELARNARKRKTQRTATLFSVVIVGGLLLLFGLAFLFDDDEETATPETLPPSSAVTVTTLDPGPTTTVDQNTTTTTEGPTTTVAEEFVYGTGACAAADGSSEIPETLAAPQKCIEDGKGYVAEVVTSRGTLEITLNSELAPGNVNNFVTLARYGYYDGADCHRIIKEFVVQCGRRNDDETQPGYTIADELPATDSYYEGVVAMANTGSPDSAGGQFFIVTGANGASLPTSYTILGQVTKGYSSTVKLMEDLADPLAENGVPPLIEITIESVTIKELDEVPTTTVPTTTTTTTTIPGDTTPDTTPDGTADLPTETDESTPATGTEAATSTT